MRRPSACSTAPLFAYLAGICQRTTSDRAALVDPVEGDECRVGLEVGQDVDDRLWEVPIESKEARHIRALSCSDGGAQVLCELSLQVERVLDCGRLDVRVQPVNLRFSEPAVGQGTERL